MKIAKVETYEVGLPARRKHAIAGYTAETCLLPHLIVKIKTDTGIVGLGEAAVDQRWGGGWGEYYGEDIHTASHIACDVIAPAISGEDPFNLTKILQKMDQTIVGHMYTKSAIDMALYDIMGKHLKVPIYNLLGGRFRERVPLLNSIGIMEKEKVVNEAVEAVSEGIKTIKIKVGSDPERDVQVVGAVREAVGDKIGILIDANQGYSPLDAIKTIKKMEKYDLLLAEAPTRGIRGMAKVVAAVDTPIMADETVWTPQDALETVEKKAADIISIYTTKPGGLFRAKKVAAVAEAAGLPSNINGSGEYGVGNAANLHLAASIENNTLPNAIPITNIKGREQTKIACKLYLDDLITEPFEYKDGCLVVPSKPGLGVELDEEKFERYGKNVQKTTEPN